LKSRLEGDTIIVDPSRMWST